LALTLGAGAASAGDTCAGATGLLQGVTSGNLGGGDSQWYSFAPVTSVDFAINTNYGGTEFDTALSVFGSCGGAMIAHDEGVPPSRRAFLRVPMDAGQTYYIQVGRAGVATGSGSSAFQLGVTEAGQGQCPGAGDCFDANGTPGCNDQCGGGLPGQACPGCCDLICGIDPFCCTNSWDGLCQGEAISMCTVVPVSLQSIDVGQ
jgi:hypothetical protein